MCVYIYKIYICHIFIHSLVDNTGCFSILAILSNTAMDIGVHVSFQISVFRFVCFLNIYPGVESLGYMVVLSLVFEEPPYCVPQ